MPKTIRFIIGLPHAGKSVACRRHRDLYCLPKIDLFDVQERLRREKGKAVTVERIWESYEMARDWLINALEYNDDIVFEHTLVKASRRPFYRLSAEGSHFRAALAAQVGDECRDSICIIC